MRPPPSPSMLSFAYLLACGCTEPAPKALELEITDEPTPASPGQSHAEAAPPAASEAEVEPPEQATPPPSPVAEAADKAALPRVRRPRKRKPHLLPEQQAAVTRALVHGRWATGKDDHARAIELFSQGIAIDPNDARLQCEAGWAAYQLEDPRAEAFLRAGIEVGAEPRVGGACLYNLGRLLEREGRRDEAALAYGDSLALRPTNEITQRRYKKLTGQDFDLLARSCPPPGRFADGEAFCQALKAATCQAEGEGLEADEVPRACEELDGFCEVYGPPDGMKVEGTPLGEPVFVTFVESLEGTYWSDYILLKREGELEVLGRIGNGLDRMCSSGGSSVEGMRWLPDGRLVVELHRRGEYACDDSPWQECIYDAEAEGKPESSCEGLSDEAKPKRYEDRPRMLCAAIEGRFRCSAPPEWYDTKLDVASTPGPVPEGVAFEALLSCPPKAREQG